MTGMERLQGKVWSYTIVWQGLSWYNESMNPPLIPRAEIFNHLKVWNPTHLGIRSARSSLAQQIWQGGREKKPEDYGAAWPNCIWKFCINVSQFDLKHPLRLKCQVFEEVCLFCPQVVWKHLDILRILLKLMYAKGRYLEDHRWRCRLHPREGRQNQRKVPSCNKFFCPQEMDGIDQQFFQSSATDCTGPIPVVWPPWMFSVRIARVSGAEIELFERDLILASWTQSTAMNSPCRDGSFGWVWWPSSPQFSIRRSGVLRSSADEPRSIDTSLQQNWIQAPNYHSYWVEPY